ncbi:TMV resistance protein N-like [Camellia sinensis]|uniref:TMV resistance protein N-like n=1 Tax=Camellia sinensis TaxID=4442 RepID=UPI0010363D9F|nr:TMV resistance protein N-like [Camellia sinensis]
MASSVPSSSRSRCTYDVFLSFRGEDTRDNFVSHLYAALAQKGIHTFKDDEKLERGKSISPELQKAIQESRFSIVVLSKNYASSRWCLDELVEILECSNTTVYPIFYHVNPSDVRRQRGSFGGGFEELVSKQEVLGMEKVQRWRNALEQVANLSGWPYPSDTIVRSESMFIQELVGILFRKLNHTYSSVSEDLVGMDSPMEKVIELLGLGMDDARAVGIWGMGGMGKTTIARAIYDRISSQFEGCSFIENVREVSAKSGPKTLQEQLISEILLEKDLKIGSVGMGVSMIRNMVYRKKILIVLDDVDESTELEKLIGEQHWFGFGSRIIITTRNQHALTRYGITHIYEVEELREYEATELFKSKAFGKYQQVEDYGELVPRAVKYAKGVPLALRVLGSFLCGRNKYEWESSLNRLKESPLNEVQQVLQISYDALQLVEKEIFLDIACFFSGKNKNDVTKILDSCGFHPIIGIDVLVKKSLVTISDNKVMMHDLIQELGWYIVRQKSPKEPGECSRLWLQEDLTRVLMENTGTKKVEGIAVDYLDLGHQDPKDIGLKELKVGPKAFAKMSNLRILKMCCIHLTEDLKYLSNKLRYLDWCGYPMKCMPSTFQPGRLVELHLTYSSIEQLWEETMPHLGILRIMNLSHSTCLTKSPDFTKVPNLEILILEGCTSMVNLHPSIGILRRLICLNLKDCKNLKSLPSDIQLESLEVLNVSGCSKLENISVNFGYMKCLSQLYLDGIGVSELPPSVGHLTSLGSLNLSNCKNLKSIPDSICQLKALTSLNLSGCSKVDKLPQDVGFLDCLKVLRADCTAIRQVPSSIGLLKKLEILSLRGCKVLRSNSWSCFFLPSTLLRWRENSMTLELAALSRLVSLQKLDLSYCNLKSIPTSICHIYSLHQLNLSGNNIESLPASMNQLSKLSILLLEGCKRLKELPELSSSVHKILADDCTSLRTILSPSTFNNVDFFSFMNCFKLVESKQNNILTEKFISNLIQSVSFIVFPGSEIPKWFSHQSRGSSISFELPPHWYNSRFLGIVLAAVVIKDKSKFQGCYSFKMTFKRLSTQTVIGNCCTVNLHFQFANSGNVQVIYLPHFDFLGLMEDYMEQLNEGGIEFQVCFVELHHLCGIARHFAYYSKRKAKYMECELECGHVVAVEKLGVHLLYEKADEEALITYRPEENMGVGVFHGDLDRLVEVVNASATTSKRKCDDLNNNNDCDAAVAGPSGSGGFDDQEEEDHLNSKRLRSE